MPRHFHLQGSAPRTESGILGADNQPRPNDGSALIITSVECIISCMTSYVDFVAITILRNETQPEFPNTSSV